MMVLVKILVQGLGLLTKYTDIDCVHEVQDWSGYQVYTDPKVILFVTSNSRQFRCPISVKALTEMLGKSSIVTGKLTGRNLHVTQPYLVWRLYKTHLPQFWFGSILLPSPLEHFPRKNPSVTHTSKMEIHIFFYITTFIDFYERFGGWGK